MLFFDDDFIPADDFVEECARIFEANPHMVMLTGHVVADGINSAGFDAKEAEAYLARDLVKALYATLRYCPVLATELDTRLAAIVDFTFNLGAGRLQTSTLRRRINQRDWQAAAFELGRWVRGGGRVLPGLVARRQAEVAMLVGL